MAECNGGCAGCEHCGRAEPDGYAPESTGPIEVTRAQFEAALFPPEGQGEPSYGARGQVEWGGPRVDIVSSGCPVRDLGDAIRAIALTHATMPGQIDIAIRGALDIVRQLDGTHGCDVCRRFRVTASSVQVGGELDPGGVSDE